MKLSFTYLCLILNIILVNSFPRNHYHFRKFRVNLKLAKKNTYRNIVRRVAIVSKNGDEIVDKSVSLFYDNMLTDMLGIAKVYNLINEETKSYYYIIIYEFLWFAFKVLKSNINNSKLIEDNEESQILFDQLVINVMLYVSFKNILFQNLLNIISFQSSN